jgi:hypothetical protein|eukprot:COSAG01_NODE_899_length_12871_cov_27.629572_8_plen_495_part_00
MRTVAGEGVAGTSPAGFGIMTRGLDPQRRGRIVALQSATGSLGGSIGYAVGGLVVQYTGWRTLFWAPLPMLVCIWLASLLVLPPDGAAVTTPRAGSAGKKAETTRQKLAQFDVAGSIVFAVFLGFLLLGVNRGNSLGWGSDLILTYFGVAAAVSPVLLWVEYRAARPILPIHLFCERTKVTAMLANNLNWMGYSGSYMLLPIYMQEARGVDIGLVGVVVFVRPLVGSLVSVLLARGNSAQGLKDSSNIDSAGGRPRWWHSPRRLAQLGATYHTRPALATSLCWLGHAWSEGMCMCLLIPGAISGPPSYLIYYFMYYESSEAQLIPSLVVALIIQGASCFTMSINCNTIVVSAVAEAELANTQAVWRMMQTVFSMVATAVMLSLAGGGAGGMGDSASFQPVWGMMLAQQLLVVVLVLSLPRGRAEQGGFERVKTTEDGAHEGTETSSLLENAKSAEERGDEDAEGQGSMYDHGAAVVEQPSAHVVRRGEVVSASR